MQKTGYITRPRRGKENGRFQAYLNSGLAAYENPRGKNISQRYSLATGKIERIR